MLGATLQRARRASRATTRVAWGYARAADALGVDIIQGCEVTGDPTSRAGRVRGVETSRGAIGAGRDRHRRRRAQLGARGDGRRAPAAAEPSAAGARVRAGEAGARLRRDVERGARLRQPVATRASWSWAPASTRFNSYAQRGSFHVIEHQMAALSRALSDLQRALRMLRSWGGIVDVCPDASPIIGRLPVEGLYHQLAAGAPAASRRRPARARSSPRRSRSGEPHPLATRRSRSSASRPAR